MLYSSGTPIVAHLPKSLPKVLPEIKEQGRWRLFTAATASNVFREVQGQEWIVPPIICKLLACGWLATS